MNLKIKDILNCTNGKLIIGNDDYECINYSKDTRTINKHDTYIGIKGENFDGNLFWKDALDKGADVVIVNEIEISEEAKEKYDKENKNIIVVKDTIIALGKMAKLKREMYGKSLKVIGVTGSVGKTSTKDMLANVISQKYKTLKTEGNYNNNIGLPLTILRLQDEEVAVIEMGMNHLGEISYLSKIAKPDISVITNVGTAHIGNLGSKENILKAKLEILDGMENKVLIINNDNDLLHNWDITNKHNVKVHTFGIKEKQECTAENIELNETSSEFTCIYNSEKFKITVPVYGEHFILNSLCAVSVGKLLDISNVQIVEGIKTFKLTAKRMEIHHLKNNITIINDSYNANFESMKAALLSLNNINCQRKIAVLGDMFELGNFAEKLHREIGIEIAKTSINKIFLIGDNSKYIAEEAVNRGYNKDNICIFSNNDELYEYIKNNILEGDTLLFKASNGMKLFNVVEKLIKDLN